MRWNRSGKICRERKRGLALRWRYRNPAIKMLVVSGPVFHIKHRIKSVVHQGFHCAALGEVDDALAHTRQQTLHGGSRYRCCRHPMEHHQRRLGERVESKAYANGLVDGLIIGLSIGIGGIWGFNVCVPSPLIFI